ncbi:MAG: hypothetical protein ACOCNB_06320 [Acetivibrio ethanolgignens]
MNIRKVVVDEIPKDCIECPLSYRHKRDCGTETSRNDNGAVQYGKIPDKRCKCKLS